jgi:hypothetical protein
MAMTKEQSERRAKAIAVVARNFPKIKDAARLQDDLHLLGIKCQRNAEKLCNFEDYVDQRDQLRAGLEKIKARHGVQFEATVRGDPRGYCLKVIMPQGDYNTWGGSEDGYGFGEC